MEIPRIVIAGSSSCAGKTTVSLGLMRVLRRRGLAVQPFKVGPDFLDPFYMTLTADRTCYNLDSWMMGEQYSRELFGRACGDADIAIVEGVMGLFDGTGASRTEGSTAETAALLDAPVIVLVDVKGMGGTFAAIVKGLVDFRNDINVAGIIANRCGSQRHVEMLRAVLEEQNLPPLVGAIQRNSLPELPSRHLGLETPEEGESSEKMISGIADAIENAIDVDHLIRLAKSAPDFASREEKVVRTQVRARVGIARDKAFHFYYRDNLEALELAGCELVPFSPLNDERLPDGLDALYIGGGYPEVHASELAENRAFMEDLGRFAESGKHIYAECGGLMYLGKSVETTDSATYEMAGIIPVQTRMLSSLKSLGYVEITLTENCAWGKTGSVLRGHEFHYSEISNDFPEGSEWSNAYSVRHSTRTGVTNEGFRYGNILASYIHLHFASRSKVAEHFVKEIKEQKNGN